MNVSKINSFHPNMISFRNNPQPQGSQLSDIAVFKKEPKKKYTTKDVIQYCAAGAFALLILPVIFMAFDGKLKLKGFGKLYKQEVKQMLECL